MKLLYVMSVISEFIRPTNWPPNTIVSLSSNLHLLLSFPTVTSVRPLRIGQSGTELIFPNLNSFEGTLTAKFQNGTKESISKLIADFNNATLEPDVGKTILQVQYGIMIHCAENSSE